LFECTGPITLFLGAKTAFFGRRTREHGATFDPFDPFDRLRAGRLPGTLRQAQGKLARDRQGRQAQGKLARDRQVR